MTTILFAAIPPALGKPSPSQSMLLLFFICFLFLFFCAQAVPGQLYVPAGLRAQPKLRVHVVRQLRLGAAFLLPADDAGLLGEFVPAGAEDGRPLAHALLHRHHLPRLLLPTQSHPGHRRHVVRRVAEEGGRRGGSGPLGGGSHQGPFR